MSITHITLDDETIVMRHDDMERSAQKAILELIEHGHFVLKEHPEGAYRLTCSVSENRLRITVEYDRAEAGSSACAQLLIPLLPFRRIIKDYTLLCESYHQAIEHAFDPSKIETIDMGRRGLHNEGAEMLMEYCADKAEMDLDTARRFFTLLYVLHMR